MPQKRIGFFINRNVFMLHYECFISHPATVFFAPDKIADEISLPEHLIAQTSQIRHLVIINRDEDYSVITE